jgi:hypothetical protein
MMHSRSRVARPKGQKEFGAFTNSDIVSTVILLATSPAACPPMPSATIASPRSTSVK